MVDFSSLKKSSADISRLTKEIEKLNTNTSNTTEDTRFWQPEVDKSGNGFAVIRFLPAPAVDGDDALPWVRIFSHGFKGPTGRWYIENSLTTLNQKDPVSEYNSTLWNASSDDASPQRKQARDQKRKLSYISNILVISDSKHPENEGKVFLFRYGKKIFDKISALMNPEFEGDEPVNPFDLWNGANFKLKIKNVAGYRNYDSSEFDRVSPIKGTDEELETIWRSEYSLKEFLDPKHFKSYDELKRQLDSVLESGSKAVATRPPVRETKVVEEDLDEAPWADEAKAASTDDEDNLDWFKNLAND
jgi:gp32 DNA binding protein like